MGGVALPFSDVDARDIVEIHPVAGKAQRWARTYVHAKGLAIEILGGFDVVGEHEVVLHAGQCHGAVSLETAQRWCQRRA